MGVVQGKGAGPQGLAGGRAAVADPRALPWHPRRGQALRGPGLGRIGAGGRAVGQGCGVGLWGRAQTKPPRA